MESTLRLSDSDSDNDDSDSNESVDSAKMLHMISSEKAQDPPNQKNTIDEAATVERTGNETPINFDSDEDSDSGSSINPSDMLKLPGFDLPPVEDIHHDLGCSDLIDTDENDTEAVPVHHKPVETHKTEPPQITEAASKPSPPSPEHPTKKNNGKLEIKVGDSVLAWKKRSEREGPPSLPSSSLVTLRHTTKFCPPADMELVVPRKEGSDMLAKFTQLNAPGGGDGNDITHDFTGSSTYPPLNGMVECLAIFDPEKQCYVLEIVDVAVTNLREVRSLESDDKRPSSAFDPQMQAKKAETYVRKMKKRRLSRVGGRGKTKDKEK